ncbi:MAG: hypothetical protein IH598_15320 [Bacteroidales bacterium]|nr:hypothetical protein [Bacteroidales bacterium]
MDTTMKKIMSLLAVVFLLSCSNTNKLIEQKKYDDAVDALILTLQKNPTHPEKIAQLDYVMIESSGGNLANIEKLKLSGQPDIWDDVLLHYQQLDSSQDKIKTLPDTTRRLMQFVPSDYSAYMQQARNKATMFHYATAKKLLETDSHQNHQQAYENLLKANELTPGFKDVEELLGNFKMIVPVHILYKVTNSYTEYLPNELEKELKYLDLSSLNTERFKFHKKQNQADQFNYTIEIDIRDVKISPENTREVYYVETAKVQDGIGYKLDEEGNFIYDSLGRKIEFPLLKTIACYVSETVKEKALLIGGQVEIKNMVTGKVIASRNISGETKFYNRSATFKGDLNALMPETVELVGTKEEEYPTDLAMILRASDRFKFNAVTFILNEMNKLNSDLTKIE